MSSYSKTKFISKMMIGLAVLAVMISGGGFLIAKNQVGADTKGKNILTYLIEDNKIYINDDFSNNLYRIYTGDTKNPKNKVQEVFPGTKELCYRFDNDTCYFINTNGGWNDPTISEDEDTPTWKFIKSAYQKSESNNSDQEIVKNVARSYVSSAYAEWKKNEVDLDGIGINSGSVKIKSEKFFDVFTNGGGNIEEQTQYCKETDHCDLKYGTKLSKSVEQGLTINFLDDYTGAKDDSVWMNGVDYLLGTVILAWTSVAGLNDVGVDLSDKIEALNINRNNYLIMARWVDENKDSISLSHPPEILIDNTTAEAKSADTFEINVDTTKFTSDIQTKNYKFKAYVKPVAKSSESPAILLGPWDISPVDIANKKISNARFGWSAVAIGEYDPAPSNAKDPAYLVAFPQQYQISVILNEYDSSDSSDGGKELQRLESAFQTRISVNGGEAKGEGQFFSISLKPSPGTINEPVKIAVSFKAEAENAEIIESANVYACVGDRNTVITKTDSSTCGLKGNFNPQQDNSFSVDWDTSGSSLGTHTVLVKGFKSDESFINDSLASAEIILTNTTASITDQTPVNSAYANLLNLGAPASSNPTGSTLRTIVDLIGRIIDILLLSIAVISVLAIIIGGMMYLTSSGNPDNAKRGQKTVVYAVYGIAVAVLSFVLENLVLDVINKLFG